MLLNLYLSLKRRFTSGESIFILLSFVIILLCGLLGAIYRHRVNMNLFLHEFFVLLYSSEFWRTFILNFCCVFVHFYLMCKVWFLVKIKFLFFKYSVWIVSLVNTLFPFSWYIIPLEFRTVILIWMYGPLCIKFSLEDFYSKQFTILQTKGKTYSIISTQWKRNVYSTLLWGCKKNVDLDDTFHSFSVSIVTVKQITNGGSKKKLWLWYTSQQ